MEQFLGYAAATLTTISFVPQVIQVIKTKDTKSISLPMYIIFILGLSLWLVYGIMLKELPIILANLFTICFASVILIYKLREKTSTPRKD